MAPMTRRDLRSFVVDVQRFRPVASVVLAALSCCPPCGSWRPGTCRPSPSWSDWPWPWPCAPSSCGRLTGLVLRYARMHAQRPAEGEPFGAVSSDLDA